MDFKTHLEFAWHQTLKYLSPLILMSLVMMIVSVVTLGILALVMMAGYIQAILEMIRHDRQPRIQDLFSKMNLFFPLLAFSIVAAMVIALGLKLLLLPGLAVICVLAFGCLYMIPLMVDRRLGLVEAIKISWRMATQDNLADQVVVVILFLGFIAIGSSVFIGILLTQPFATVFLVSVYLEKVKKSDEPADQPPPPD